MHAIYAAVVKQRVHRDLPEAGELRLALAETVNRETVVRHAVVERVRPVSVGTIICDRDRCRRGRIVGEAERVEHLERVDAVVEERGTEADDGRERDTRELVEGNQVPGNLVLRWRADVGHTGHDRVLELDRVLGSSAWEAHRGRTCDPRSHCLLHTNR